jgi:hypothetical protein
MAQYELLAVSATGIRSDGVCFQYWDGKKWLPQDVSAPINQGQTRDNGATWSYKWSTPPLDNTNPAGADTVYWRAIAWVDDYEAESQYGLVSPPTATNGPESPNPVWELCVIVIDSRAPSARITQVGGYADPATAIMSFPLGVRVTLVADVTDNDDNPQTTDIANVRFEYTRAGANWWTPIASVTWRGIVQEDILNGSPYMSVGTAAGTDKQPHVSVIWDSTRLKAGAYELRVVATDIEGNSSILNSSTYKLRRL